MLLKSTVWTKTWNSTSSRFDPTSTRPQRRVLTASTKREHQSLKGPAVGFMTFCGIGRHYNEPMTRPPSMQPDSIPKGFGGDLPLDIVFQIFEEHQLQETPAHPVETLLFVSKSWSHAALENPRLWARFNMKSEDFEFWARCIPRRLSRCPADSLLDIRLEISFPWGRDKLYEEFVYQLYSSILLSLTGHDGEVAGRWRRFTACNYHNKQVNSYQWFNLTHFFAFPTPHLQELELFSFDSSSPIFPETPSLKIFRICDVRTPTLPKLSAAVDVTAFRSDGIEEALATASHLVSLRLMKDDSSRFHLSTVMPHLKFLQLTNGLHEDSIKKFCAPALERLSFSTSSASDLLDLLRCNGIIFAQLQELTIDLDKDALGTSFRGRQNAFGQLLRAAKNLRILELSNDLTAAMALGLFQRQCKSLYQDHGLLLKFDGYEGELGQDGDREPMLVKLLGTFPSIQSHLDSEKPLE